uniref:Alpha/beta hydrolase fold-3 domain-containing protein n=1 Tax=Oryza brachyantha TaxID=4533 RepID=J3MY76_ORYBR
MDPATTELRFDSPLLRIHNDGRVEHLFGTDTNSGGLRRRPPLESPPRTSSSTAPSASLPASTSPTSPPPMSTAASLAYHRYLNSVVSKAGALAVSVNYRLGPEHLLPVAFDDSWAAFIWTE